MKFYLLFLILFISETGSAGFPLLQGPGVSDDTYRQFAEGQKMTKLTDYLKENLDFFDVKNEEVNLLNQIKETNPQKYQFSLRQLMDKIVKRPLTEKNRNFLCLANAEIKAPETTQNDAVDSVLRRLCNQIDSMNSSVSQLTSTIEALSKQDIDQILGTDFILLKNGERVDGVYNDSSRREINQWTFINNGNVPLVFYGNIDDLFQAVKVHLDRKDTVISEGNCRNPEIKTSIISELNYQILFPDNCLAKNYMNFNQDKEYVVEPILQKKTNLNWAYWGLAAIVLTAFFVDHELVIEY